MKRTLGFFLALALCLVAVLSSCAIKQNDSQKRTVSVTGTGQVDLESDQATIILAVQTRNNDVTKAVAENADRMTSVQQALTTAGVSKTDIATTNYAIYQDTSYQNGRTVLGQYVVSNDIQIVVRDIKTAGALIDTAIKAGANSLSSLTFTAKNRDEAVKQARLLAIKQAEETAALLATSSGATLGKVITIVEENGNAYPRSGILNKAMAAYADTATPVSAGKTTVSITVNATYELQ